MMDSITNATADLAASTDKFITQVYKEIAKKVWKSHLIQAKIEDDYLKGIDYHCVSGSIQFKELKSGIDRGCFDREEWPFETEVRNRYGKFQKGWIYETSADFLIFIRSIRATGEWKAFVFDWKKLQPYILANVDKSYINRFGSAYNKMFSKKELEDYLIAEIN
jgi:hypothetical protein